MRLENEIEFKRFSSYYEDYLLTRPYCGVGFLLTFRVRVRLEVLRGKSEVKVRPLTIL